MRLDCGHCVVREWTRADKASLVEPLQGMHANTGHFGYWLVSRFGAGESRRPP
jgi:hypothetical protein